MSDELEEEAKKKGKKRVALSTSTLWLYFLGTAVTTFILLFSFHRTVLVFIRGTETPSATSPTVSSPSVSTAVPVESREEGHARPTVTTKPPPIHSTVSTQASPPTTSFTSDQIDALRKKVRIENMRKHTGITSLSESSTAGASSSTLPHNVDSIHNHAEKVPTTMHSSRSKSIVSAVSSASQGKMLPSIMDSLIQCPSDMVRQYDQVPNTSKDGEDNLTWCQRMKSKHNVVIGRSWGSLGRSEKLSWDSKKCNELISLGKVQTCAERWGWKWFDNWSKKKYEAYEGGSNVTCIADVKTTTFCEVSFLFYLLVIVVTNLCSNCGWSTDGKYRDGF